MTSLLSFEARAALAALVLLATAVTGCRGRPANTSAPVKLPPVKRTIKITVRAGKIAQYPCLRCHDKITHPDGNRPATIKRHSDQAAKLEHFKGARACYSCHNKQNMNRLRLFTGETVTFDASYRLCGQCHGEKLRDFHIGAHGKLVGRWRGAAVKYNCTDCHDPHRPKRPRVRALSAPAFPKLGIRKGKGTH